MPELLVEARIAIEWTDILGRVKHARPKSADVRSPGVHLSGVNKYVLTKLGQLDPADISDEFPLRMAVGMAWEDWAVGLWPDLVWQPGEWCKDGVYGTPDGFTPELQTPVSCARVDEFKATWKSKFNYGGQENLLGPKGKLWMWQLMGNCFAMNVNHALLHILWVNGDYRPPCPEYMTYLFRFTTAEMRNYWNNIVLPNRQHATPEEH